MQSGLHAPHVSQAALVVMLLTVSTVGCQSVAHTGINPPVKPDRVNVGYGMTERPRVTASVASLDSTDIERFQVVSLEEALGRLPGVTVTGRGPDARVRIRGTSSFLGTNDPLYVIDGMPMQFGMSQPLSGINPHDVARIDVLKDGAAAIYGSRGANGVVLITMKRAG
jgi:TonB-dependent SusC/RagA subfamily outer membrane receptor